MRDSYHELLSELNRTITGENPKHPVKLVDQDSFEGLEGFNPKDREEMSLTTEQRNDENSEHYSEGWVYGGRLTVDGLPYMAGVGLDATGLASESLGVDVMWRVPAVSVVHFPDNESEPVPYFEFNKGYNTMQEAWIQISQILGGNLTKDQLLGLGFKAEEM
jgi:hypothetical protein